MDFHIRFMSYHEVLVHSVHSTVVLVLVLFIVHIIKYESTYTKDTILMYQKDIENITKDKYNYR